MTTSTQPLVGTFVADALHSRFAFSVKHMKVATFSASFDDVDAKVVADDRGVRIEGAVRVDSLSVKNADFRGHVLQGADFFDAANYPEMTFRSTDVVLNEDGTARVDGELTIKGITKPFTATGTYQPVIEDFTGALRTAVEFTTVVDRRDWNFTWQAPLPKGGEALGYDITISAHVELVKES